MDKRIKRNLRAVIYIKDIATITGRKPGAARNLYLAVLRSLDKGPKQFITYQEFSNYTGICEDVILEYLQN